MTLDYTSGRNASRRGWQPMKSLNSLISGAEVTFMFLPISEKAHGSLQNKLLAKRFWHVEHTHSFKSTSVNETVIKIMWQKLCK